eukprot:1158508-Pelagomonas_calceolata.AAC.10
MLAGSRPAVNAKQVKVADPATATLQGKVFCQARRPILQLPPCQRVSCYPAVNGQGVSCTPGLVKAHLCCFSKAAPIGSHSFVTLSFPFPSFPAAHLTRQALTSASIHGRLSRNMLLG